jgi:hypothetical protein
MTASSVAGGFELPIPIQRDQQPWHPLRLRSCAAGVADVTVSGA